ncbi:MAG: hypothetical protein CL596_05130 [Alteromonas sp.]|nr:hypothetical protein [Alteromonas sp.]|tara:strand:- start:19286 stop:19612 length:327 start_codon:yes stop_codon:yes gene_type:complete
MKNTETSDWELRYYYNFGRDYDVLGNYGNNKTLAFGMRKVKARESNFPLQSLKVIDKGKEQKKIKKFGLVLSRLDITPIRKRFYKDLNKKPKKKKKPKKVNNGQLRLF